MLAKVSINTIAIGNYNLIEPERSQNEAAFQKNIDITIDNNTHIPRTNLEKTILNVAWKIRAQNVWAIKIIKRAGGARFSDRPAKKGLRA